MISCAVCGLSKTPSLKDFNITFHRFPPSKKRSWSIVCSQHFTKDCFVLCNNKLILKDSMIPAIDAFMKNNRLSNIIFKEETEADEQPIALIPAFESELRDPLEITPSESEELLPTPSSDTNTSGNPDLMKSLYLLGCSDAAKSRRILQLQEENSRHKKRITYLRKVVQALQAKNFEITRRMKNDKLGLNGGKSLGLSGSKN